MRIIFYHISLLLLASSVFGALSSARTLDNPFSYESGINDCDVIKYNGEYYITGNWLGGDMFQSRNLVDWGQRKHIFTANNTWHEPRNSNPDMDIHGTHIAYDNGMFHLYAHLDTTGLLGVVHAVSDNVTGPYVEPVDEPFVTNTIDVKTFRDEDGTLHYYSTRFGGVSGNHNDYRSMSDYSTFTSNYSTKIWPTGGWEINPEREQFVESRPTINEGPFVFKYRSKYYMLYNANHTGDTSYAIGCAVSDTPDGFSNAGKQPDPVLGKTSYSKGSDTYEIYTLGQPWVVDGLNGFEKWAGYFAIDSNERSKGRTQRIDRIHFFDREMYIDGPTNRYIPGYHPAPAEPQLRSLFYLPDGDMPAGDWNEFLPNGLNGQWEIRDTQAYQSDQSCFSFNLVNRDKAANYLYEANFKMAEPVDNEDKAGVVAYYKDSDNWMLIGFDRSAGYGADNWYCHIASDSRNGVIATGNLNGKFDYSVYHKIRVEKNSSFFKVWLDDVLLSDISDIDTGFIEPGIPGLFTDHCAAAFDGITYTIGWDEYDDQIKGWGDGVNGIGSSGNWIFAADGLSVTSSGGYIFKGDMMETYEFSTHIYKRGQSEGNMGVVAAVTDTSNYLSGYFNLAENKFVVRGAVAGDTIAEQSVDIADKDNYNLRVVKLADAFIFFIDGQQVLTVEISLPASQVGLFTEGMNARYNGILVYRTEAATLPSLWKNTDIGDVGFEGSVSYNEGSFAVNGSGSDIWNQSDGFHYVYKDLYGVGSIVARVVSNDITHFWNKAAIMVRNDLTDGSPMATVALCGGGNLQFLWRSSQNASASGLDAPQPPYEQMVWLGLAINDGVCSGFFSYDGSSWQKIGSANVGLVNDHLKVGLAVTSHDNNQLNGAVFDNVMIDGCTPGEFETDLNGDCTVDIFDLGSFAMQWLVMGDEDINSDFDGNSKVDISDYSRLADHWLISYDD